MSTIKDIAEKLNITPTAVSYALNGRPGKVSEATRTRVLETARALNYQVHSAARALRTGRAHTLGFYNGFGSMDVRDPFIADVVVGLHNGCDAHEQDLLLHRTSARTTPAEQFAEIVNGKVDGVLLVGHTDDPLARKLAAADFPTIALADTHQGLPSVVIDDAGGARLLAERLADRGHRTILYRAFPKPAVSVQRRLASFRQVAQERDLILLESEWNYLQTELNAQEQHWLSQPPGERPTAIACCNDGCADTTLATLHSLGLDREIAVVGFDGLAAPHRPRKLTTIRAPFLEAAQQAVTLLTDRLQGKEIPDETTLPVELVDGDTD